MPTIPKFTTGNIDERVQSAAVERDTSATVRTLASIGEGGKQRAVKLLTERKQHQAKIFSQDKTREKNLERQERFQDLTLAMNPATGIIEGTDTEDDGKDMNQAMNDWEFSRFEEIKKEAPTELASRYFEKDENPRIEQSLLRTDAYQHGTIIAERENIDTEINSKEAKSIPTHDPTIKGSQSTLEFGTDLIEDTERRMLDRNRFYTPQKIKALTNNFGHELAIQTIDTLLIDGNAPDAAKAINFQRLLKDKGKKKILMKSASEAFGRPVEDLIPLPNGSFAVKSKGFNEVGREVTTYFDPIQGKEISKEVITKVAKETLANLKPIGLEVERENKVLKYITPSEQIDKAKAIIRLLKTKNDESKKKLMDDLGNFNAGLRETNDTLKIRPDYSSPDHPHTKKKNHLVKQILESDLDPIDQRNELVELTLSEIIGKGKDSTDLMSPDDAKREIETRITEDVDIEAMTFGFPESVTEDPAFATKMKIRAMREMMADYQAKNQLMALPEYYRGKDKSFQAAFDNRNSSEEAFSSYMDKLNKLQDRTGVSAVSRKKFPQEYVNNFGFRLREFLDAGDERSLNLALTMAQQEKNIKGEFFNDFLDQAVKTGKIGIDISSALLYPFTTEGQRAARQILSNERNKGDIEQAFKNVSADPKETRKSSLVIKKKANELMQTHTRALMNKFEMGEDFEASNKVQSMLELETKRIFAEDPKENKEEDATEEAFRNIMQNNWLTASEGESHVVVPRNQLPVEYTEEVTRDVLKTYNNPSNLADQIDWETTNPEIKEVLDRANIKGKEERSRRALEMVLDGVAGKWVVVPEGNRWMFKLINRNTMRGGPVWRKDGKALLSIPFKDALKDPKVQRTMTTKNISFGLRPRDIQEPSSPFSDFMEDVRDGR